MKHYKITHWGWPVGWAIDMLIAIPFIHITPLWWKIQLSGLSICLIMML